MGLGKHQRREGRREQDAGEEEENKEWEREADRSQRGVPTKQQHRFLSRPSR